MDALKLGVSFRDLRFSWYISEGNLEAQLKTVRHPLGGGHAIELFVLESQEKINNK